MLDTDEERRKEFKNMEPVRCQSSISITEENKVNVVQRVNTQSKTSLKIRQLAQFHLYNGMQQENLGTQVTTAHKNETTSKQAIQRIKSPLSIENSKLDSSMISHTPEIYRSLNVHQVGRNKLGKRNTNDNSG